MKFLKKYNESFSESKILDFLINLENIKESYESKNSEDLFYNFNYTQLKDKIIINSDWGNMEEAGSYKMVVYLITSPIKVSIENQDQGNDIKYYKSLDEVIEDLKIYHS